MNFFPALTIGLAFGLVVGIAVYYIMDFFEAGEKANRDYAKLNFIRQLDHATPSSNPVMRLQYADLVQNNVLEIEPVEQQSNCVVVVFDGKTKNIELPPLE